MTRTNGYSFPGFDLCIFATHVPRSHQIKRPNDRRIGILRPFPSPAPCLSEPTPSPTALPRAPATEAPERMCTRNVGLRRWAQHATGPPWVGPGGRTAGRRLQARARPVIGREPGRGGWPGRDDGHLRAMGVGVFGVWRTRFVVGYGACRSGAHSTQWPAWL